MAAPLAVMVVACNVSLRAAEPRRECSGSDRIALRTLSWTDAEQLITQRKGKVVLVDVWTTTCPACREHFPDFVELQQRFGGQSLACISVNCDYDGVPDKPPKYYAPRVLEFLGDNHAQFTNLLLSDPLIDFLDAAEIGSTPTYVLYGANGELLQQFDGSSEEFTFAEVVQAVESAISARRNGGDGKDGD